MPAAGGNLSPEGAASPFRPASPYNNNSGSAASSVAGSDRRGAPAGPTSPQRGATNPRGVAGGVEPPSSSSTSAPLLRRPRSASGLSSSAAEATASRKPVPPSTATNWAPVVSASTPTAAAVAAAAAAATGTVLGGAGGRSWLKVDADGAASVVRVDKSHLATELGVQARDLRLLDPHFNHSYPSAILCRDRALVVNLEHIKLIITPTQVLVLNAGDPSVRAFVDELCRRLAATPSRPFGHPVKGGVDGDGGAKGGEGKGGSASADSPRAPNGREGGAAVARPASAAAAAGDAAAADASEEPPPKPFSETPFELRALEVALETVCAHLEAAAGDLEAAAHPALDDLTAAVTTPNLERVRRVKTRLVRLTTRVETLREVLEKILDDDSDMHDMNLTARALDAIEKAQQQQQLAMMQSAASLQQQQQQVQQPSLPAVEEAEEAGGRDAEAEARPSTAAAQAEGEEQQEQQQPQEPSSPFSAEQLLLQRTSSQLPGGAGAGGVSATAAADPAALVEALEEERERDDTEIAQVEQVLEPYFMQCDNTFNRLQTLCEYIDDTEDYINIELDNHRNQLIRLELMLTAATFAVSLVGAISGIFGMNLVNGNEGSHAVFVATSVGSSIGAVAVFAGIFAVCKKRGLI